MFNHPLIDNKNELRENVRRFDMDIRALIGKNTKEAKALANGCSHAVEWVAIPDGLGSWLVAFSKYVGYNGITPLIYDQYRKTNMTGTDTKRRVEKLGGIAYGVGRDAGLSSNHPAVDKVHEMCALMGKSAKLTAKVRVFADEARPATMDVLVAAIRAADLTSDDLDLLFAEVRRAV